MAKLTRFVNRGWQIDWNWRMVLSGFVLIAGVLLFITWAVAQIIVNSIVGL